MDSTQKTIFIFSIFIALIIAMIINMIHKKQKIREEEKLTEDAQRYFVTICHKLLTPFGDEKSSNDFITFRIFGNHFFALRVVRRYDSKTNSKILISARYEGHVIIVQENNETYSYGAFEKQLQKIIGDSLVYDFYTQHLWNEMNKKTTK